MLEFLEGIAHLPSKFSAFSLIAENMTIEDEEGLIKKLISTLKSDEKDHQLQFLIDQRGHLLTQL